MAEKRKNYDEEINALSKSTVQPFSYEAPKSNYYDNEIGSLTNRLRNRSFNYDYVNDPLYQIYKEQYTREGDKAMQNTLAQVSARTGGLASSYATTASNQAYQAYLDKLNDKVPELYQMAYSRYRDEGNDLMNQINLLQNLGNTAYQRDRDAYNTAYSQFRDSVADANNNRNFQYNLIQDAINDDWKQAEFDYKKAQDQKQLAKSNQSQNLSNLQMIAQLTGNNDDYYKALGMTPEQISRAKQNQYKSITGLDLLPEAQFNVSKKAGLAASEPYVDYDDYVNQKLQEYYAGQNSKTAVSERKSAVNEAMSKAYNEAVKQGIEGDALYQYLENAAYSANAEQEDIDEWMEKRRL